jgi:hypothetical protein
MDFDKYSKEEKEKIKRTIFNKASLIDVVLHNTYITKEKGIEQLSTPFKEGDNSVLIKDIEKLIKDSKYIKEIEIDIDTDLKKLKETLTHLSKMTLNIKKQFVFKIRKLGNYSFSGAYISNKVDGKSIVVIDVKEPSSLLHELTHLVDISNEELLYSDFRRNIVEVFKEKIILPDDVDEKIEEYYKNPKEIIARLSEIYFKVKKEQDININIDNMNNISLVNDIEYYKTFKNIYFDFENFTNEEWKMLEDFFKMYYNTENKNIEELKKDTKSTLKLSERQTNTGELRKEIKQNPILSKENLLKDINNIEQLNFIYSYNKKHKIYEEKELNEMLYLNIDRLMGRYPNKIEKLNGKMSILFTVLKNYIEDNKENIEEVFDGKDFKKYFNQYSIKNHYNEINKNKSYPNIEEMINEEIEGVIKSRKINIEDIKELEKVRKESSKNVYLFYYMFYGCNMELYKKNTINKKEMEESYKLSKVFSEIKELFDDKQEEKKKENKLTNEELLEIKFEELSKERNDIKVIETLKNLPKEEKDYFFDSKNSDIYQKIRSSLYVSGVKGEERIEKEILNVFIEKGFKFPPKTKKNQNKQNNIERYARFIGINFESDNNIPRNDTWLYNEMYENNFEDFLNVYRNSTQDEINEMLLEDLIYNEVSYYKEGERIISKNFNKDNQTIDLYDVDSKESKTVSVDWEEAKMSYRNENNKRIRYYHLDENNDLINEKVEDRQDEMLNSLYIRKLVNQSELVKSIKENDIKKVKEMLKKKSDLMELIYEDTMYNRLYTSQLSYYLIEILEGIEDNESVKYIKGKFKTEIIKLNKKENMEKPKRGMFF